MTSTDQRWVVVTGAASGIGEGVARQVSDAGYGVLLVDVDQQRLEQVAAGLPGPAVTLVADLTDPATHDALRSSAREVGTTWGLVNCAGISLVRHFLDNTEQDWTRILRVNLEGTFRATHAVGAVLNENGGGAVINIASISGVNPAALQAAYAASKAGVIGFTQGLAYDFGPLDITVNVICPGIVRTPIWDRILTDEAESTGVSEDDIFAQHVHPIPLGRPQTAADIGDLSVFLLSDKARNISGESINVTGGMSTVFFDFHEAGASVRAAASQPR